MATIVHMIPTSIYERLVDEGILDQEFPSDKQTPIQRVIENLPSTLQDQAKAILTSLIASKKFSWNADGEIQYDQVLYPKSSINDLISSLVHGSSKFYNLAAADIFLTSISKQVPEKLFTIPTKPITKEKRNNDVHVGRGNKKSIIKEAKKCNWIQFEQKFKFKEQL